MQCRLIFWRSPFIAIIHKALPQHRAVQQCPCGHALVWPWSRGRCAPLQAPPGERCPTLSCFFGKPQPRWGSRNLNITPDFIAGSLGWPIVSYLENGHCKKITEQKSQKQPPNQPPSWPCFDIGGDFQERPGRRRCLQGRGRDGAGAPPVPVSPPGATSATSHPDTPCSCYFPRVRGSLDPSWVPVACRIGATRLPPARLRGSQPTSRRADQFLQTNSNATEVVPFMSLECLGKGRG